MMGAAAMACAQDNGYSNEVATASVGTVAVTCANPQGWTFNVSAEGQDGLDVITVLMTAPRESVPPAFTLIFR